MTAVAICHTARVSVTIGDRIRDARLDRGWSVPELAAEVGCSVDRIKQFEKIGVPRSDGKPPAKPPNRSRYLRRTLNVLEISLAAASDTSVEVDDTPLKQANREQLLAALYAIDPNDPVVSRADRRTLVTALARLIYAESSGLDQSNVEPFVIEGYPERGKRRRPESGT